LREARRCVGVTTLIARAPSCSLDQVKRRIERSEIHREPLERDDACRFEMCVPREVTAERAFTPAFGEQSFGDAPDGALRIPFLDELRLKRGLLTVGGDTDPVLVDVVVAAASTAGADDDLEARARLLCGDVSAVDVARVVRGRDQERGILCRVHWRNERRE